jgi:hypothetical protein
MKPRYKDASLQRVYDTMLTLAADASSELYHNGEPRRGAGHRAAFWDGYNGMAYTGKGRSAHVIPGTISAACFMAGREFAKQQAKVKPRTGPAQPS